MLLDILQPHLLADECASPERNGVPSPSKMSKGDGESVLVASNQRVVCGGERKGSAMASVMATCTAQTQL